MRSISICKTRGSLHQRTAAAISNRQELRRRRLRQAGMKVDLGAGLRGRRCGGGRSSGSESEPRTRARDNSPTARDCFTACFGVMTR